MGQGDNMDMSPEPTDMIAYTSCRPFLRPCNVCLVFLTNT